MKSFIITAQNFSDNEMTSPVDLSVLDKIDALNNSKYMDNPSKHSKEARAGNYPVKNILTLEHHDFASAARAKIHGGLRYLVGDLGKQLDKTSLPEKLQEQIAEVPILEKEYRLAIAPLIRLHEDLYGTYDEPKDLRSRHDREGPPEPTSYRDKDGLIKNIIDYNRWLVMSPSQVALFKETQVVVDEANKTTEKLMNKMTEEFNDIAMFRLKGQEKPVLNIPSAAIPNFCAWLYFAELGAAHLGDTTAIPQAQKTAIYERLGIQYKIIPRLTSHLRTTKTAQQPTFIKICEAAIAKTGKALVSCGSYEQLSSHENIGYFMRSLGIDEPTYNTLRQQLDTAPKTAAVREGGCPYGHGPK